MKLILDVDNTLYHTQEYLKQHQLLSAPIRSIPYWSFYKVDDAQLERDIFLFKSIPLRVLNKNQKLLDFIYSYKRYFKQIIVLTGRSLTNEEKAIIRNDLNTKNIQFIENQSFTSKMQFLDQQSDFIVVDDYTGLESFVRDLHLTHNAYYIIPDLNNVNTYSKKVLECLFSFDHMIFNVFLHPEYFDDFKTVKDLCLKKLSS